MNTNDHKKMLEFITLPQCIMAVLLTLVFLQAGEYPGEGLTVVFVCHILINIAVIPYYMHCKAGNGLNVKGLYAFLAGFIVIFPAGVYLIFRQFSSVSAISPETLYLLCNSVSLIYLSSTIIKKTAHDTEPNITKLIMICLGLPLAIYLLLHSSNTLGDSVIVLAMGLLCVFLFLLGKLGFMVFNKNKQPQPADEDSLFFSKNYRIFIAVTAVLLPQAGLYVNEYLLFSDGGLLGDFSSPWFYVIAAINGLLLLVDIGKTKYKLPLFYLKAVGFTFIAYFTLIFIPYMPFAIFGILYFALGLLVYVPAVIFVAHFKQLRRDYRLVKNVYSKPIVVGALILGFLTLPAALAANFSVDRLNFHNAMSYVNVSPDPQRSVDFGRLKRSVGQIDASMLSSRQQGGLLFMPGTPIISTAYRYIALDNMFFTEDTLTKIQKIFMPEEVVSASEILRSEPAPRRDYDTNLTVSQVEYDAGSGSYTAWIDFEITQLNDDWLGQYRTEFAIPDGCFVTDYYLYVGNEKKRGIITDKRAAQVAYESIIRTPKDPGIVYYENDNRITLRVYPFSGNEMRRTGLQIMYSQNQSLQIDGQTVDLVAENPIKEPIILDGIHFIPADYKKNLPNMERQPLYYFLLDAGNSSSYFKNLEKAKAYSKDNGINSRYYAVSYQAKELTDITSAEPAVQPKGGFNTAYAMSEIFQSVPEGYYPIIVLVTENVNRAVALEKTRLTTAFPETDCYYRLNDDSSMTPYRFDNSQRLAEVKQLTAARVINYDGTAINAETNETLITNSDFAEFTGDPYRDAFILQKNTFLAETEEQQISFIKESMGRRLLTKNTSFIVMETKEQEDMLLALQEQFLNGKSVETPSVMMSEPGWAWILALGVMILSVIAFRSRMSRG